MDVESNTNNGNSNQMKRKIKMHGNRETTPREKKNINEIMSNFINPKNRYRCCEN